MEAKHNEAIHQGNIESNPEPDRLLRARQGVGKSLPRGEGFRVGVTNIKARGPAIVAASN